MHDEDGGERAHDRWDMGQFMVLAEVHVKHRDHYARPLTGSDHRHRQLAETRRLRVLRSYLATSDFSYRSAKSIAQVGSPNEEGSSDRRVEGSRL